MAVVMLLAPLPFARAASPKAYVAAFAAEDKIVLVDEEGSVSSVHPKPLVQPDAVALAPDGRRLVYTSIDEVSRYQVLYLAAAPDFVGTRIGASTGWHRDPTWSPDGSGIVFGLHTHAMWSERRLKRDQAQLYKQDLSTMEIKQLSSNGMCHHFPAYIPNANAVLFIRTDCNTSWNVFKIDLDTGQEVPMTVGRVRDHEPTPSPDGKRFVYVHVDGTDSELRLRDIKGKSTRTVAHIRGTQVPQPRWSRDGGALMWWADKSVWRIVLDGKSLPVRLPGVP
jgi:Tol biopolymer transport system component